MNTHRWLAVLLLAIAAMLFSTHAAANTSCSASMTNLDFGTVDPQGGMVDVSATLSYSCTFSGGLFGSYVSMCFNVGSGTGGNDVAPRTLKYGNNTMDYQLYTDAAHSLVWGSSQVPGTAPQEANIVFPVSLFQSTRSGTLTMYGRVPSGQANLVVGAYSSSFNGSNARLDYAYNENFLGIGGSYPATCTSGNHGSNNFAFTVSANVASHCRIDAATDLDFGAQASNFAANLDQTSALGVTCTNGTAWQIGLDNGQHALGTTRRMISGSDAVTYELYRDIARSLRWGNTLNSDTLAGTGSGLSQNIPVYGRVPPQPALPAGTYLDKITVTVTY